MEFRVASGASACHSGRVESCGLNHVSPPAISARLVKTCASSESQQWARCLHSSVRPQHGHPIHHSGGAEHHLLGPHRHMHQNGNRGIVAAYSMVSSPPSVSSLVDLEGSDRVSLPQLQFPELESLEHRPCPCGSVKTYESCCGRVHGGQLPRHAAELARARFCAHLLGNLQHLENSMHPDSPDQERPQLLTKACHVFQTLEPRLIDMCHGMVPGSDAEGGETHVVALALLIQRDSAHPHVFIEVESYELHEGHWMYHHKEHAMPTFGSFPIFHDKYGPGHHAATGTSHADPSGRYRFDLVSPRRTPTLSRAPTPSARRATPAISRNPTPQSTRRQATPTSSRSPTPSARRTPALSRKATPQPRRTPQATRPPAANPHPLPPSRSRNQHNHLNSDREHLSAATMQLLASDSHHHSSNNTTSLATTHKGSAHQWLVDSWPEERKIVYMDDVDGNNTSNHHSADEARQLAAQQEMVSMLMDPSVEVDSWLLKQSGFRYDS